MIANLAKRFKKSPRTLFFQVFPLLLAFLVFLGIVYPRYRAWRSEKELLLQKEAQKTRYLKEIRRLELLLKKTQGVPKELSQKVFSGPDPYVLVAGLREKMEKVSGVSIRSFRIVKRQEIARGLERVEINFVLQTDIRGLSEVLWKLEQEPRAVRLKRVTVFVRRSRKGETLNATLNLEGLFWLKKA